LARGRFLITVQNQAGWSLQQGWSLNQPVSAVDIITHIKCGFLNEKGLSYKNRIPLSALTIASKSS
jgi:hypothetical protein